MKLGRIDKAPRAGIPTPKHRFAYLALLKDIAAFPPVDSRGVLLKGDIVMHEGTAQIPLYLTTSMQEYSYETVGDDVDSQAFKVKFTGSHPGSAQEVIDFARNMRGEEVLVVIPSCDGSQPYKVLGTPCAPLVLSSKHQNDKATDRFTFTFEQEVSSDYIYLLYTGQVQLADKYLPAQEPGTNWEPGNNPPGNTNNGEQSSGNYYTKEQIDEMFASLQLSPGNGTGYYTIEDIDAKLETMRDWFMEIINTKMDK